MPDGTSLFSGPFGAIALVALNAFFVAAEFALVKVRIRRLEELRDQGQRLAGAASWLSDRLDASLSTCQLGITMASLGLGWVGEPAVADVVAPLLGKLGIESEAWIHGTAFAIAFTVITTVHLVIGEQAPKIFAIRKPEATLLWCALPLRFFYIGLYPFMAGLNVATRWILKPLGVGADSGHEEVHTQEEIRALLTLSHRQGELTSAEHRLMHGVLDFDDLVCRQVMVPRVDVVHFRAGDSLESCLEIVRETKHTRYPVCSDSLDDTLGVVHIKDLVVHDGRTPFDLATIVRPPQYLPETMRVSQALRHFQASHQLLALVVDEFGGVSGIVSLENVLEPIVGPVQDEFDAEGPDIVPVGPRRYLVRGSAPATRVVQALGIEGSSDDADTFSGLIVLAIGRIPRVGDVVALGNASVEVMEADGGRARRVRVTLPPLAEKSDDADESTARSDDPGADAGVGS
ncbi:MAG: HlyC/CorC family transporter [Planctomycetes bacterium]|nr:HlyC/CorC family transporter [Planctomycetota bacterium]